MAQTLATTAAGLTVWAAVIYGIAIYIPALPH